MGTKGSRWQPPSPAVSGTPVSSHAHTALVRRPVVLQVHHPSKTVVFLPYNARLGRGLILKME